MEQGIVKVPKRALVLSTSAENPKRQCVSAEIKAELGDACQDGAGSQANLVAVSSAPSPACTGPGSTVLVSKHDPAASTLPISTGPAALANIVNPAPTTTHSTEQAAPQCASSPSAARTAVAPVPVAESSAPLSTASPTGSGTAAAVTAAAAAITPPLVRLSCAASEDWGSRAYMEDRWVMQLEEGQPLRISSSSRGNVTATTGACADSKVAIAFCAVLDGHGGSACAEYVAQHLHASVLAAGLVPPEVVAGRAKLDVKQAKAAIVQGFKSTDQELLQQCAKLNWLDGAVAVAVWVVADTVLVANVGDAQAVLARIAADKAGGKQGTLRALSLTKQHLAIHAAERARIEKAGGAVVGGRLNGKLQVSRSFGDAALKQAGCSAVPDVQVFQLTERDHFLLLACDGFWGVFDAQGAVDFTAAELASGRDNKAATNRLLHQAVRVRKCTDNATVLLLRFERADCAVQLSSVNKATS